MSSVVPDVDAYGAKIHGRGRKYCPYQEPPGSKWTLSRAPTATRNASEPYAVPSRMAVAMRGHTH